MPYDDPDYGDPGGGGDGGLPSDWQPDPNWVPPQHWGYGEAEPVPADLSTIDPATGIPRPPPTDTSALLEPGAALPYDATASESSPAPSPVPGPAPALSPDESYAQTVQAAKDFDAASLPPPGPGPDQPPPSIPPPLGSDAISGAGNTQQLTPSTLTPDQHYAQTVQQYGEHPFDAQGNLLIPDAKEAQQYFNDLRLRDPVKFATLQTQLGDIKTKRVIAEQQRIANEDFARQQSNAKIRDQATAESRHKSDALVADALRVSKTPIDRTGGVNKIGAVLMGVIGGLIQGKQGGRNIGLDALNDKIERSIAAQKADIANQREGIAIRKGALADEYARTGDEYHSAEVTRIALLQHAHDQLSTEAQNYAPDGTTALKIADMQGAIVGQQRQALQAYQQKTFDNSVKAQTAAREQQLADETMRANRAREALEWTKERREAGKDKADSTVWSPQQLGAINTVAGNTPPPVPPIPMTQGNYTKWLATQKEGEQLATAARANNPDERARELAVPGIVDSKGAPAKFRSVETAAKAADTLGVADDVVRMTDELIGMVEKNGYSTDFGKSEEWQRAQQTYAALLLTAKERDHLGALSASDIELEQKKIGSTDPTQLRDTVAGMRQFRHNTIESVNASFRNQVQLPAGTKLGRWEPPPLPGASSSDQLSGKTAVEAGQEATPSTVGRAARVALAPLGYDKGSYLDTEGRHEQGAGDVTSGLAEPDAAKVTAAIQAATAAAPKVKLSPDEERGVAAARADAVQKLAAWSTSDRPGLSAGVLNLVSADPALYAQVLALLPPAQREERQQLDAMRAQLPGAGLPPLPGGQ